MSELPYNFSTHFSHSISHLSNVSRCCPLPNLCQTNKVHSIQRVKWRSHSEP